MEGSEVGKGGNGLCQEKNGIKKETIKSFLPLIYSSMRTERVDKKMVDLIQEGTGSCRILSKCNTFR